MIGHLYTIFWVMIGWVFFRSNTVGDALKYIGVMLGIGAEKIFDVRSAVLMQENRVLFLIGIIGCFPVVPYIKRKWSKYEVALDSIKAMAIPLLFFVCCCYLVKSTYNPFIYFNF